VARAPPLLPNPAPHARAPYPLVPTRSHFASALRLTRCHARLAVSATGARACRRSSPRCTAVSSSSFSRACHGYLLHPTAPSCNCGGHHGWPSPGADPWSSAPPPWWIHGGRHRSSGAGGLLHRGASSSTSTAACSPMVDPWVVRRSGCLVTVVHPGAPPPPQRRHEGASPVVDACSSGPPWWIHGGDADLAALAAFPLSTLSVLVVFSVVSFAQKVCISRTF
jgi:hypothetical protein